MVYETEPNLNDYEGIIRAIQYYLAGAKSGDSEHMKPGFHSGATICGHIGADLFAGPIQILFDWNDENGPATDLNATIASINLEKTAAMVRLDIENWSGHRFTDMFTLVKFDGTWKIVNKAFHFHDQQART